MTAPPGHDTRIRVVYPKPEQHIFEDSTFLMGAVTALPPGGQLSINHQPVPLSTHGFFAWKIPIHAGMNPIHLEVRPSSATPPVAQELLALYGVPPVSILPATPLAVHADTLNPGKDVWLTKDDTLTVACSASVDADVRVMIPGLLDKPVPLVPLSSDQSYLDTREVIFSQKHWTQPRIPVQGYYQAQIPMVSVWPADAPDSYPLVLQLRHGAEHLPKDVEHLQTDAQHLEKALPGRLTLLQQPRPAMIKTDRAVTRVAPENGDRLTPQRTHTRVEVNGLRQGWARLRLDQDESFYVALDDLTLLPADTVQVPMALESIQTTRVSDHQSRVSLAFAGDPTLACPVQVAVIPSETEIGPRLQVRVYGVSSQCECVQYPPGDAQTGPIRQIHWRPVADDVLEVWLDLQKPLTGYDYAWRDGQWQLAIHTLPTRLADIHVLIDPGHGGAEFGATGLNGLPEKDLNLTVSRLLRDALLREGFRVSMTRDRDEELSLQARGQCVIDQRVDMVLSIHHNALPDGRDPLKAQGACTFYYQPFSKPLANALLAGLTDNQGSRFTVPNYGLFDDSLYMTRIHQALAVLVEVGFFTNPAEFERLIDPAFQREAARRLAVAAREYCLAQTHLT